MGEPTVSLESLELSGNILDRHDIADASAPGLLEVTGVSQTGTPTVSGLNDFDYQQLTALSMGLKDLNQLSTVNKVPIPPEIMEHFNHIKCHCTMGLFPEIGRAWLTIDTDLYIWTYENVRDVAYFDGLSEVIISVGLVAPKPGIFVSDVRYLLVLTTPVEIVILGVTFKDANNGTPNRSLSSQSTEEMQLMSGPIFLLNTDQVAIMCVQGTDDGRIFLGGRDGCLYEIVYQAETNWFGKRCRKVNHSQGLISHLVPGLFKMFTEVDSVKSIVVDNSRRLLYVLLSKGSIETWDIGTDAGSTRRIARLSHKEIFANATAILRTLNTNTFLPVSAICPLTADDSPSLHLVAVTENGVRLYFSTLPLTMHGFYLQHQQQQQQHQQQMQQSQMENFQQTAPGQQPVGGNPTLLFGQDQQSNRKPQGLYMLHVRVPPGYTPNTTTGKPTHVHTLHVTQGSVLMVSTPQQDQDFLWSLSTEQFQSQQNFIESATVMPLDGQVWAVGELKRKDRLSITTPLRTAQHPRKVALLTNQGVHIVCLQRSVDVLQQLLLACRGPNNDAVKAYFQIQTEAQACATALLLACLESYRGTEVGEWAAQAFVLYGGEPYFDTFLPNAGTTAQRQLAFNSPITGAGGYGSGGGYDGGSQQGGNFGPGPGRMWASTPFSTPGGGRGPLLGYQQHLPQLPSDGGGSPNQSFNNNNNNNNVSMGPHVVDSAHFHYSAKHTALYLHVSRMMRCVWNRPCINDRFHSSISQVDCATLLEDLYALRRFLETVPLCSTLGYVSGRNGTSLRATLGSGSASFAPSGQANQSGLLLQSPISNGNERGYGGASGLFSQPFAAGSGGGYVPSTAGVSQRACTEEALQEEKRSLDALARLIKQSCEVIGLWKVICEHQCHQLVEKLAKEEQNLLKMCTFRDLIISRADVCGRLIVTLINTYLADNASVGPISSKLREVCPTLYRHEDAVSHKATEILLLTRSCTDREKKEERLRTALQLCKSAVPNLPLGELCAQFSACGFYAGVIELCTVCAAKSDPNEAALHFYRNNEPMDNQEGFIAYQNRTKCYREVKAMLDFMYESGAPASGRSSEAGVSAYSPSEHPSDDRSTDGRGNRADIQAVIGQALQHTDQLLHIAVYEWLLSKGLHSEMLEITEPSLGIFLSRAMTRTPENMQLADLLWKYHERNGQHASAAKILDRLANSPGDSIDLLRRIEYLARAVMCMRSESVGFSAHNGVLLKDLEDKLEVAQIQRQVYDALALLAPSNDGTSRFTRDALHQLDTNLYNLTQLYSDFAEQYELWECKLTILNCSHHNDPLLIESVWTHILDRELSGPEETAECCRRMLAKVKSLALEYDSSGCCFPLAFIVRELEIRCFRLGLFHSPVPEALLEMNLDVEELINIYSRLVSMNERIWMTDRDELYLIRSTTNLLSLIAAQPTLVPLKNRRKVLGKSQELSTAALNILYTKPDTQPMIDSLRDTQSKLQRLL